MIRRPPRSTLSSSSAASDVYKRQVLFLRMTFSTSGYFWGFSGTVDFHGHIIILLFSNLSFLSFFSFFSPTNSSTWETPLPPLSLITYSHHIPITITISLSLLLLFLFLSFSFLSFSFLFFLAPFLLHGEGRRPTPITGHHRRRCSSRIAGKETLNSGLAPSPQPPSPPHLQTPPKQNPTKPPSPLLFGVAGATPVLGAAGAPPAAAGSQGPTWAPVLG